MEITPYEHRLRSRLRARNGSRSTSSLRRPSLNRRSLSASSLNRLSYTPTHIDGEGKDFLIPTVLATLDNTLPTDFFKQELIALIKALRISKWHKRQLTPANIVVLRISGALTNSIYKIEYRDTPSSASGNVSPSSPASVPSLLLRVYGKNVESIIDRDYELGILVKLSPKKIGPKLMGIFGNGRFEQFLEGFITMTKKELRNPVISQMIGRRMKDLHYKIELDDRDFRLEFPQAWLQIMKWINNFETDFLPQYPPEQLEEILLMPWPRFKALVFAYRDWLFSKYDVAHFTDNYKFCHNDTQYGNLLLRDTFDPTELVSSNQHTQASKRRDGDLAVIDFEYSGANFPAYDIADHFCEWMSDYADEKNPHLIHDDRYPSQAEQLNLLRSYVEYEFKAQSSNLRTNTNPAGTGADAAQLVEFETKKLYNEVIYWRATVQFFWCVWGLLQNGPPKPKDPADALGSNQEEKGVNSTFRISTGLDSLTLDESALVDDDELIASADDQFQYLQYAQQKAALIVGDMVSFGLLSITDIAPHQHNLIKFLDTRMFDI